MVTSCDEGFYRVVRSRYRGEEWVEEDVVLSRVWGTSRARTGKGVRSGFVIATIGGKKLMLLTMPVYSEGKENQGGKGRLHLWLTDRQRVYDVGPISAADEDAAASSLFYKSDKQGELISVYEKRKQAGEESYSVVSVRLTEQLEQVKSVVRTWTALDKALQRCTGNGNPQGTLGARYVPLLTEGLLGFLAGTLEQTAWKDEYLCVDATVHGAAASAAGGVTFSGAGAGAEWPVGKLGQNQPYYSANTKFALVATVTIHAVPEDDTPLLGVRMNDGANTELFGLSYTKDRKWKTKLDNAAAEEHAGTWEANTAVQVALQMDWDDWSLYVGGEKIYGKKYSGALFNSHRISHFFFGMDGTHAAAGSPNVTVANVLLYSRVLGAGELKRLQLGSCTIPPPRAEGGVASDTQPPAVGATQTEAAVGAPVPARPPPPPPPGAEVGAAAAGPATADSRPAAGNGVG
ncbi:trans-sialidase, partial [Trypanosoma conorhini]